MRIFSPTEISQLRYNAERQAQDAFEKRRLDREGLIEVIFRHYVQEIESKINTFYSRYAGREGITIQEAKARADAMDVQAFAERARQAVLDRDFSQYTNEWLKVYNLKMRVSREELLKYDIQLELYNLTKETEFAMITGMEDEYRRELERQAGILGNSVPADVTQQAKKLINADFYGATFSERIWGANGRYDIINKEVMKALGNIVGQQSDYRQEVKRLRSIFGVSKRDAFRLVRSETRRMNSMAQMDSYKENGFTHYIYVAEPGACLLCAALDQTAIPVDQAVIGDNYPLKHPNCRCSTYGVVRLVKRDTGLSNIDEHNQKYGSYEDAIKDLSDIAEGKIKNYDELRNKSKDYLDLSYFGFSRDRATNRQGVN